MLDAVFTSVLSSTDSVAAQISTGSYLMCTLASIILGAACACIYMFKHSYSKNFVVTLALLPLINTIIHNLTGNYDVNAFLPKEAAVALILISVFLTILAGFIPSKKAARQDPVIALRSE